MFLPWAPDAYQAPLPFAERQVLLYWGYINERLDVASLHASLDAFSRQGLRLRFVGPCDRYGHHMKRLLGSSPAVEWMPACSFEALDTSDCFAALLPYRLDYHPNLAAQLPNKALQLLSRGLPLISTPLPHLQSAPFLIPYDPVSAASLMVACEFVLEQFSILQPAIAEFVQANGPEARLRQLLAGVR